ncbi:hypothetical protein [Sabulibacter ruber]|uniref:hypothetical protein n=1 Tax=Sabulibacter ruber TaxID=2811901 RepID=UPI001A95A15E|nr:hypothetical protein [Sabulibacter ruber]
MTELPKEPGFQVPEHYFDALPTRIMQRTAYASAPAASPVTWFRQFRTAVAGASLGVVFALSFLATQYYNTDPSAEEVMAQVSQKDIYHYLTTRVDLETSDLAEVPAVKPRESLEFLDVRSSDITEEQRKELLEEAYEYR